MTTPTEADVEKLAIDLLTGLGYRYTPDNSRNRYDEVIWLDQVRAAIQRINPTVPPSAQEQALKEIERLSSPDLLTNNEAFHRMLTEGVKVSYHQAGHDRGDLVWLIDFAQPAQNEFCVTNQFIVRENQHQKRLDVLLFINGLPLVVMELKSGLREKTTLLMAYQQLGTYKQLLPTLFTYNTLLIISDGIEAKVGSLSAGFSRFMAWKHGNQPDSPFEALIHGLLNPATLLDFMRHFVVFERSSHEDPRTKITTISTEKKIAAYHQYYAVNKAIESTLRATGALLPASELRLVKEDPISYGLPSVEKQPHGDRKGGVIWHTQGSGKSLSMVFYTGKIVLALNNPTVVVITDRNDLDDQLFETFAASAQLLRQTPIQAENRAHLKTLLKVAAGGVVFTTMQKFQPDEGNVYEQLSDRSNIVVIADEAHRTQYGFQARIITKKDEQGQELGQELVYGLAKYLRDALPNATYLGFTGTPIEKTDVNTPAVFGHYVDIYDIAQAVDDGATVKIYYESRLAKITLSDEGRKLVADLDDELQPGDSAQKAKAKWTQLEALVGSKTRLAMIAQDIISHFEQRQEVAEGKGLIITMSRRIAADLYEAIIALRADWHHEEKQQGVIKVVMTANSEDGATLARHHTTKQERRQLAARMRDPHDTLKLVIVCDMWLTGFDVPSLHTLYIDKAMKGHNLMQAIARVNRVYKDKPSGLVVDYLGIASDLQQALAFYAQSGGRGDPLVAQGEAVVMLEEWLEIARQMFHGFAYQPYFQADTRDKLRLILAAQNFILGLENGQKRFIDIITALSRVLVIAMPHEAALAVKEEVAFFQAIKARLTKFETTGLGKSNEELETAIRQVIDGALVSQQVIDVFDAAGLKKPDMSILSEEFLTEIKGMAHQNLALEVLKKLLHDELKGRAKKNLVQSQSLMELLEQAIRRYHNKIITAVEVIEELIALSKEIQARDNEAANLGMTEFEYAFYTAVANNDSAREMMQHEKLRALAVVLTQKVRENASIDWTLKESVRAKLKVMVKRTLREFGYPPDMELLATETVLKQAEAMAAELTGT